MKIKVRDSKTQSSIELNLPVPETLDRMVKEYSVRTVETLALERIRDLAGNKARALLRTGKQPDEIRVAFNGWQPLRSTKSLLRRRASQADVASDEQALSEPKREKF